ncbi:prephenate dehydrogenase/arogenate dehydrogenase family protein [Pelagibacteraceae bacterium]|jgi:cyclohexadieny/prephenate dehydrogenase|nr:prephenate dehydrogenase/arogenate dehydrogenase family protein [Pelagibacteraceae bacterium]
MFDIISIIGCGLIGSSILRAVKNKKIAKEIRIFDHSKEVTAYIKKENICANISNDIRDCVINSDLIIIATPLSSYKEIILSIKNSLKKDAILTDTGSVKKEVMKIIHNINLKNVHWIPSHPIAGTEETGPKAGLAEMFEDRWCIISPPTNCAEQPIKILKAMWEKIGSKVKIMTPEEHDKILSLTSHLPHAIAYNIVRTVMSVEDRLKQEVIQYSAGGLRDFTRIAASNPVMWRDIFLDNSENVSKDIDNFIEKLKELKKAVNDKNGDKLYQIFNSTTEVRKEIIKAGQDINKPDFGRKKD